jgi:drug/metabolite transporter (DMT)-like permease
VKPKRPGLGYLAALTSAALVGLFTVLNKWLLIKEVPALTAGAWTYFAAGIALLPWAVRAGGLKLQRPWVVAGWLLTGTVVGPTLYFLGLQLTSGVQGVLLINTEAVFTAFLAVAFFHERVTDKTIVGGLAIVVGGIVMSWPESGGKLLAGPTLGNLLIAVGCLSWATENNLGRLLGKDVPAVTLVCVKALAAALVMGVLAVVFRQGLQVPWRVVPGIVASGAVALACSLAFFYIAMQHIGSGRTGLVSSTSILWGVVAALLLLHERLTPVVIVGGLLMLGGLLELAWEATAKKEGGDTPQKMRWLD